MNTLADRLTEALKASGKTQADLARHVGIKPPSVHGWFSGKTKALKGTSLIRAAAFLGVRDVWLNEGRGPMARDASEQPKAKQDADPSAQLWGSYVRASPSRQVLAQLVLSSQHDEWPAWTTASLKSSIATALNILEEQLPKPSNAVSS